jgi:DNA-binding MarR family transcriptional regulator
MAKQHAILPDDVDIQKVADCLCLRLRRTTRQITQIYDRALEPPRLTVNQFGLLARLYGSNLKSHPCISIGALADLVGMHPTTLNRNLKPLKAQGLVADAAQTADQRVRSVQITEKGRAKFRTAVPFWRDAETQVRKAIGARAALALNRALERASLKIAK